MIMTAISFPSRPGWPICSGSFGSLSASFGRSPELLSVTFGQVPGRILSLRHLPLQFTLFSPVLRSTRTNTGPQSVRRWGPRRDAHLTLDFPQWKGGRSLQIGLSSREPTKRSSAPPPSPPRCPGLWMMGCGIWASPGRHLLREELVSRENIRACSWLLPRRICVLAQVLWLLRSLRSPVGNTPSSIGQMRP